MADTGNVAICRGFVLGLTALALIGPVAGATAGVERPTQTKTQAEVNVLRVVARKAWARRIPGLVDPKTHLLADNTAAICHGRGRPRPGRRYRRFVCVVQTDRARARLYLSYRVRLRGGFRIGLIAYRTRY
jgi:hypothetical protein